MQFDPLLPESSNQAECDFFPTRQPGERSSDGVSVVHPAKLHALGSSFILEQSWAGKFKKFNYQCKGVMNNRAESSDYMLV